MIAMIAIIAVVVNAPLVASLAIFLYGLQIYNPALLENRLRAVLMAVPIFVIMTSRGQVQENGRAYEDCLQLGHSKSACLAPFIQSGFSDGFVMFNNGTRGFWEFPRSSDAAARTQQAIVPGAVPVAADAVRPEVRWREWKSGVSEECKVGGVCVRGLGRRLPAGPGCADGVRTGGLEQPKPG